MFVVLKNGEKYYVNRKTKRKMDEICVFVIASSGFDTKEEAEKYKLELESAESNLKFELTQVVKGRWKSYRKAPKKARR